MNADTIDVLAVEQNSLVQYNLYTYCLNNPITHSDMEGKLTVMAAAMIGGAIGGALISAVSYAVSTGANGENIEFSKLVGGMIVGAAVGALSAAVGIAGLSPLKAAVCSIGVGLLNGQYTRMVSDNVEDGIISGIFTSLCCFTGTFIDTRGLGKLATGAVNYCTTLFVGTPFETASVALQNSSLESKKRTIKPTSDYLGGSTKKSCGPYRRGWAESRNKRSFSRMRSASYFYLNMA